MRLYGSLKLLGSSRCLTASTDYALIEGGKIDEQWMVVDGNRG
jgi:hypothetical protein